MDKLKYQQQQGRSRQYELLMELITDKHTNEFMTSAIHKELENPAPDCCLKDEPYFYHDGLWDIVPPDSHYISEYIPENGNEDDECQLLVNFWCRTIAETGNVDYMHHIAHFMKVNIEGY
jgi:hypothetical protein